MGRAGADGMVVRAVGRHSQRTGGAVVMKVGFPYFRDLKSPPRLEIRGWAAAATAALIAESRPAGSRPVVARAETGGPRGGGGGWVSPNRLVAGAASRELTGRAESRAGSRAVAAPMWREGSRRDLETGRYRMDS